MQWMHDDEERREHREGHKVTVRIIIKLIMKQHKMLNPTKKKQNVPHPLRQHRKTSSLFSMVSSFPVLLFILGVVSLGTTARAQQQEVDEKNDRRRLLPFLDRFTYEETTTLRSDGYHDYAPQDWNTIACPNSDDECIAYQDKWQTGKPRVQLLHILCDEYCIIIRLSIIQIHSLTPILCVSNKFLPSL